ncbi:MAG: hypothetical protein AUJ71_01885 [Candidatus Omnitrophica bacterium CG1_02_49_16]|nr:MAG: hypothetical protein AUJ71_01885 [Candidatus Omnitrophica bacterium CG1_02_49_16]
MSILAVLKNIFSKKPATDASANAMKKEIAMLMTELKKLYERNAELTNENNKLKAALEAREQK